MSGSKARPRLKAFFRASSLSVRLRAMSKAIGLKMFPLLFCLLIGTLNLESTILRTVEAGIGYCPTRLIVTDTIQVYGKTEDDVRISGGTEAERNELPWQAFIRVTFWSNTTAVCGGTYIGNTWVLSAAHCFYGYSRSLRCTTMST